MISRAIIASSLALVSLLISCSGKQEDEQIPELGRQSAMDKRFALTSQTITLPTDEAERWPSAPGVEQIEANCRACHSPSMVLTQPPLTHEEWVKVVDKMRTTYKAAISEEDMPMILAYLDAFSARQAAANSTPRADAGAAR